MKGYHAIVSTEPLTFYLNFKSEINIIFSFKTNTSYYEYPTNILKHIFLFS